MNNQTNPTSKPFSLLPQKSHSFTEKSLEAHNPLPRRENPRQPFNPLEPESPLLLKKPS
jgi:hypothetical protein